MFTAHLSRSYGQTSATVGTELAALLSPEETSTQQHNEALSIDCSGVALPRDALMLLTRALSSSRGPGALLVHLNLNHTALGPQGARFLALSLRQNQSLRRLHISECHAGDEGLAALANVISSGGATTLGQNTCVNCSHSFQHRSIRETTCLR